MWMWTRQNEESWEWKVGNKNFKDRRISYKDSLEGIFEVNALFI